MLNMFEIAAKYCPCFDKKLKSKPGIEPGSPDYWHYALTNWAIDVWLVDLDKINILNWKSTMKWKCWILWRERFIKNLLKLN